MEHRIARKVGKRLAEELQHRLDNIAGTQDLFEQVAADSGMREVELKAELELLGDQLAPALVSTFGDRQTIVVRVQARMAASLAEELEDAERIARDAAAEEPSVTARRSIRQTADVCADMARELREQCQVGVLHEQGVAPDWANVRTPKRWVALVDKDEQRTYAFAFDEFPMDFLVEHLSTHPERGMVLVCDRKLMTTTAHYPTRTRSSVELQEQLKGGA